MDAALTDIAKDAHRAATQQLGYTCREKSMDALSARISQSHDASKAYLTGENVAQTNKDVNQVLREPPAAISDLMPSFSVQMCGRRLSLNRMADQLQAALSHISS